MKRLPQFLFPGIVAVLLSAAGCKTPPATAAPQPETAVPPLVITETKLPVVLDGELKDAAWAQAPGYSLQRLAQSDLPPREALRAAQDADEPGVVKLLYDNSSLYVGVLLGDSDLVQFARSSQSDLARTGDLVTVVIKAHDAPGIWSFSAAPGGWQSSLYCPGRGLREVSAFRLPDAKKVPGFVAKTALCGTLNQWSDNDTAWSAEFAIPRKAFETDGKAFSPARCWTVLVWRQNVARTFAGIQYSSIPALPAANFHWCEYYAPLEFR